VSGCSECDNELPVSIKLASQEELCSMEFVTVLMEIRERGRRRSTSKTVDTVAIFIYEHEIW
jgi:hypothetical protein